MGERVRERRFCVLFVRKHRRREIKKKIVRFDDDRVVRELYINIIV